MRKTEYYNLDVLEGSDKANIPISQAPNVTAIDEQMHANASNGFSPATEQLNGMVHNLTRQVPDAGMIRWIATAPYAAGDTFTVDGVSVTARTVSGENLPSGAYIIGQCVQAFVDGANMTVFVDSGNAHTFGNRYPSDYWQKTETVQAGRIYRNQQWMPTGLFTPWPDNYNSNWRFYEKSENVTFSGLAHVFSITDGSDFIPESKGGFLHAAIITSTQPLKMTLVRKWRTQTPDGLAKVANIQIDACPYTSNFSPSCNCVIVPRDQLDIQIYRDQADTSVTAQVYICTATYITQPSV